MRRTKAVLLAVVAMSVALVSCEKNPVDEVIDEALENAFSGFFETGDGTQIELTGTHAIIRKVGSYVFSTGVTKKVGDYYIIGASPSPTGNAGEYRGNVVNNLGLYSWGTITLSGNRLTITRQSGDGFSAHNDWTKINPPAPGDGGNSGTGTTGPITLVTETGLSGARLSSRYWKITVPTGTKQLVVETGEVDQWSGNLGDLFVSRGTQPTVSSREPYNYTAQCASIKPNRESENCTFNDPPAGEYHILLYGYHAYYGTTLRATIRK
jgi:hypothetical protein